MEILRLEWTNGFIENKLKIDAAPTVYPFKESERISGSCPNLFVWNGERFEYLTDAFISGPMGVPLDRGIYFPVKDRELILIPGDRVRLRDGRLDIRFIEELHETVFLDRARLLVVDHPEGTEVLPHSRLAPVPAPAEPFYIARDLLAPARARGSDGSDLTVALARVDGVHADFFHALPTRRIRRAPLDRAGASGGRRSRGSGCPSGHGLVLLFRVHLDDCTGTG
ncbi:hypothetical protein [Candidatus Thiosymbion oneisti]|uniref:hypothetical protein n=1 Tax=Candidatus Thiosymbion oneisti TaxID=589554 RepID=UPI00159F2A17|nr:hypothetical protein [Candidatus Thiosymbion oneisti]